MRNKETAIRLALACGLSLAAAASAVAQPATAASTGEATASPIKAALEKAVSMKAAYGTSIDPQTLGSVSNDLVFTPVTPCRIADSRLALGPLQPNTTRQYDVDGSTFSSYGGYNGSCGIPSNVAYAVAMTITSVNPAGPGNITAWGYSGPKPTSSSLNFAQGQIVANTTIVPVLPGGGPDFSIASNVSTNVVIDVVGYFAPPVATALDCTNATSATTSVANNTYTAVDAFCPAGYSVTGGGTYPTEGTQGRPNIWMDGSPTASNGNGWRTWVDNQTGSNRTLQTYARCCRIPGR